MEQVSTNQQLHILMLEDAPNDAELAEHELRKAGIVFTSMRVETQDAFIRALEEFRPDIILTDYKLPDFDGIGVVLFNNKLCAEKILKYADKAMYQAKAAGRNSIRFYHSTGE